MKLFRRSDSAPRPKRRFGCLSIIVLLLALIILAIAIALAPRPVADSESLPAPQARATLSSLRTVASFGSVADPAARSVALFEEAGRVIQHPRCMNCHPRTDRPTQTDAMRPHMPWVSRGSDGGGTEAMRCTTCHQDANFAAADIPGNPKWHLAPAEMSWQGKSLGDICRQIQNPARGGMTHEELLHHMAEDELVGWAWNPGESRTPAPGTQAQFGALIAAWIETGAQCPA